jgi:ParB-like chromosome segregation protein Spo0J
MNLAFAPDAIETWPLLRLQLYAKAHGAGQVAKIAASMAEFGWTVPCIVGEDGELAKDRTRLADRCRPLGAWRESGIAAVPVGRHR